MIEVIIDYDGQSYRTACRNDEEVSEYLVEFYTNLPNSSVDYHVTIKNTEIDPASMPEEFPWGVEQ